MGLTVFEICAGGGGQALGLEKAGFDSVGVLEIDPQSCETLRLNRPEWDVLEDDVQFFDGSAYRGVDLLAGGVPCPPFSIAGKQLGRMDERDLFPDAIRIAKQLGSRAVLLENVRGFASGKFKEYREWLFSEFRSMGYEVFARVLNASDFGVPQLRPRFVLVAIRSEWADFFEWPGENSRRLTVGAALADLMAVNGWKGAIPWSQGANDIAPTIVGGSKKHGGPDLGPTRAKRQWAELGVDGKGVANEPPSSDFPVDALPKLTNRMVARVQGFPDEWEFSGKKTAAYRQIGNAFPPPVSRAVGHSIRRALSGKAAETPRRDSSGQLCWLGMEEASP